MGKYKTNQITAYCDSSTTAACIVFEGEDPEIIGYPQPMTNNIGEYIAVIYTLDRSRIRGIKGLLIYSDSQLVVNQVAGLFKCHNIRLLPYRDLVRWRLEELGSELRWISREENPAGRVLE